VPHNVQRRRIEWFLNTECKRCERNLCLSNLMYCPGIRPEKLSKNHENPVPHSQPVCGPVFAHQPPPHPPPPAPEYEAGMLPPKPVLCRSKYNSLTYISTSYKKTKIVATEYAQTRSCTCVLVCLNNYSTNWRIFVEFCINFIRWYLTRLCILWTHYHQQWKRGAVIQIPAIRVILALLQHSYSVVKFVEAIYVFSRF
jgi:hypothetical protein